VEGSGRGLFRGTNPYLSGATDSILENPVRLAEFWTGNRTRNLLSITQKCKSLNHDVR
jgi:hypothetical protein